MPSPSGAFGSHPGAWQGVWQKGRIRLDGGKSVSSSVLFPETAHGVDRKPPWSDGGPISNPLPIVCNGTRRSGITTG